MRRQLQNLVEKQEREAAEAEEARRAAMLNAPPEDPAASERAGQRKKDIPAVSKEDLLAKEAELAQIKGDCAYFGYGGNQNYEEAKKYYELAGDKKCYRGYSCLGRMFELGLGVESNSNQAFEYYKLGAEGKEPTSLFALGKFYEKGLVRDCEAELSLKAALEYYDQAARLNNSDAITKLGYMYERGQGVPLDAGKALEYYRKAAAMDNGLAINYVGVYHHRNGEHKEAVKAFQRSKQLGCARGANNLGLCFEQGLGVVRDLEQALLCYQDSADKKHAQGMTNLAYLYMRKAKETKQHAQFAKAAYWFREAIAETEKSAEEAVLNEAHYYLGFLYEKGLGVEQDFHTAYRYYRQAAALGHPRAFKKCGDFVYSGQGVLHADKREAFRLFEKAAQLNDPEGYNALGLMYERGLEGVEANRKRAIENYSKAHEGGCTEGTINLALMYEKSEPERARALMLDAAKKGDPKARKFLIERGVVISVQDVQADSKAPAKKGTAPSDPLASGISVPRDLSVPALASGIPTLYTHTKRS
jgi:TPR repeat protein